MPKEPRGGVLGRCSPWKRRSCCPGTSGGCRPRRLAGAPGGPHTPSGCPPSPPPRHTVGGKQPLVWAGPGAQGVPAGGLDAGLCGGQGGLDPLARLIPTPHLHPSPHPCPWAPSGACASPHPPALQRSATCTASGSREGQQSSVEMTVRVHFKK